MFTLFALIILWSCSNDDLLLESVLYKNNTGQQNSFPIESLEPVSSGTIPKNQIDTSLIVKVDTSVVTQSDSTLVIQMDSTNVRPVAIAEASPSNGIVPLRVVFTGSNSSDDQAITSYKWNFEDGATASTANTFYTFAKVGSYEVELTTTDAEGLSSTDKVTIRVDPPNNQAPIARASASLLYGDAPLTVDFTGSYSSDDNGVVNYYWDFGNHSSSAPDVTHTFNEPGTYNVKLTVNDDAGLTDEVNLTITVTQAQEGNPNGANIPCSTGGGMAGDSGNKIWCWDNIEITEAQNKDSNPFSNGQLRTSSHCNIGMVTRSGDRLYFKVNPSTPAPQSWCNSDYNYRAEIRENPSDVNHPPGTEVWYGWNQRFESGYLVDGVQWLFWQLHDNNPEGVPPAVSLWIASSSMDGNPFTPGEIVVVNAAQNPGNHKYSGTGIIPKAGDSYDIVVHLVHGNESTGSYKVWIDGTLVYSAQERTLYSAYPWGGYGKWGIYKWLWRNGAYVNTSKTAGTNELNTSIGPLRIVTRRQGDVNYGANSYSLVVPD